ncbi:phage holin family protein [Mycolicibacterium litorale]|uniref:phage holin family protein n=1 Tax=Mycolicibacterium litorale TaxID=758802 RepID=UPI003CE9288A
MLIIALVLAVVGLAALVTAVVTGNALIAWVCIVASVVGVVLLIVDAVRERSRGPRAEAGAAAVASRPADDDAASDDFDADYPDEPESAESFQADPDDDTRAVPIDERHEDEVGADHPEEPTTR